MRLTSITVLLIVFLIQSIHTQSWKNKFFAPGINVHDLEIEFDQYWSVDDLDRSHRDYKSYARLLEKMKKRTKEDGTIKNQMSIKELHNLHRNNQVQHQGLSNAWRQIGPKLSPTRPNSGFSGVVV